MDLADSRFVRRVHAPHPQEKTELRGWIYHLVPTAFAMKSGKKQVVEIAQPLNFFLMYFSSLGKRSETSLQLDCDRWKLFGFSQAIDKLDDSGHRIWRGCRKTAVYLESISGRGFRVSGSRDICDKNQRHQQWAGSKRFCTMLQITFQEKSKVMVKFN